MRVLQDIEFEGGSYLAVDERGAINAGSESV
jgi:hypothetical protein